MDDFDAWDVDAKAIYNVLYFARAQEETDNAVYTDDRNALYRDWDMKAK